LIAAVMLLTIFEGAIRKWVFASNPTMRYATYFSKDILFIYAGYLGLKRGALFDTSWMWICAALIILPSAGATLISSNPVGVLLSLRAYLLIPTSAFLAATLIQEFRNIERCAILVAISAIGVAIFSTYQYSLPQTHYLNRYANTLEGAHVAAVAGHVRATGTFAYISGMGMLAGCSSWAGTFLSLPLHGRHWWIRSLGFGGIVAGFVCAATSMSRTGVMLWGVTLLGGCLLYFRPRQIILFLLAALFVLPLISSDELDEAIEQPTRTERSDSLTSGLALRVERGGGVAGSFNDRLTYVLTNLLYGLSRHPLGEGLGIGQNGGSHAIGMAGQSLGYESEWGRIAYEIGPVGLAAVLFIRFAACRRCWQSLSHATDNRTRLVAATTLPCFAIMSLGWMAFNHTGNSFAWAIMTFGLTAKATYSHPVLGSLPAPLATRLGGGSRLSSECR
jgi:hypothetical protein